MQLMPRFLLTLAFTAALPLGHAQQPTTVTAPKPDASAAIEKPDATGRFRQMHQSFLDRGKAGPIGLLFLGDSITAGWTKAPDVWKEHYEKYQPANFGIGGDQTHHVIWRIENGELDGIKPNLCRHLDGVRPASPALRVGSRGIAKLRLEIANCVGAKHAGADLVGRRWVDLRSE